ncbi:MAG: glycosyltransferase family 2 protein [Candidatus Omnitrophica bacterium]|nr:glycosyltransferase family 2 protein [Candidatus Omnitrophota bacterium]
MELSIVIVNWNTRECLKRCLASIYEYTSGLDFEVIVADNNSSDGSRDMAGKDFPYVNLIANAENYGFSKANNIAIRQAKGGYILILNPDTEIRNNAFGKMVSFLEQNKDVGILAPKLIFPDGSLQESVVPGFSLLGFLANEFFPGLPFSFNLKKVNKMRLVANPTAACLLIRKEVFEKIGLFDEDFFVCYEDVEFTERASKKKIKALFFPEAEVVHYKSQSSKRDYLFSLSCEEKSIFVLIKKYYGRFGICVLFLSACFQLVSAYIFMPISYFLFKRPRDISYFKLLARTRWSQFTGCEV